MLAIVKSAVSAVVLLNDVWQLITYNLILDLLC